MKSYQQTLNSIQNEIETLKRHAELVKEFTPDKIYLIYKDVALLLPHKYIFSETSKLNKIVFKIIATDTWSLNNHWVFLDHLREAVVPVELKDLALYVHFKLKAPIFEKIIKTGRFPRR